MKFQDEIEESLPYIVLITLLSIDAIAFLTFLPETKSRPLNDQMSSKEKFILKNCISKSNDDNDSNNSNNNNNDDDDNLSCLMNE